LKNLILGSQGFIGAKLVGLLQGQGHKILTLNKSEFLDEIRLISVLENTDVIINCIGAANVGSSYTNTSDDFESNVVVIKNVLEVLRRHSLQHIKLVNLSSAAVYGNPQKLPVKESDPALPLSPYGYHKYMAELLIKEYAACFGLKTVSMRIFSAYGNGQKKLLLWDLHKKIQKSNAKIVLFGTGNESRDFIHIEDISQQILLAINNADFLGEAINVANGREVKISEIVELYQQYYPNKFDYEFNGEVRLGDPLNWCADISIMESWSYRSIVNLENGIAGYIRGILNEE
jgi:dTDP-glucose 4,6-dehydratase/UDP-glucose 4-epimerase